MITTTENDYLMFKILLSLVMVFALMEGHREIATLIAYSVIIVATYDTMVNTKSKVMIVCLSAAMTIAYWETLPVAIMLLSQPYD